MTSSIDVTPTVVAATPKDLGIETAGQFFPYNSVTGFPAVPEGYRSVNTCYRQTDAMKKKGTEARPNVYVTIPSGHISVASVIENIETLAPYISAYLMKTEDQAIKDLHKARATRVVVEVLTLAKILDDLEDSGSALNSEQVIEWFTEVMAANLLEAIATKNSLDPVNLTDGQTAKIKQVVELTCNDFVSLASGRTTMAESKRNQLSKYMVAAGADTTPLGIRFISRFASMKAREVEAMSALEDDEMDFNL